MRISIIGTDNPSYAPKTHQAFTLIEILIVMLLLSIVTLMILIGPGVFKTRPYVIEDFSSELYLKLKMAQAQAMFDQTVIRFSVLSDQYHFSHLSQKMNSNKQTWLPFSKTKAFRPTNFPKLITLDLSTPFKSSFIDLFPSGEITPFTLQIMDSSQNKVTSTIEGELSGDIKWQQNNERLQK